MLNLLNKPFKKDKIALIIVLVAIFIVVAISISSKFYQLNFWNENKQVFYSDDIPMMTTLDAYKFTRHADEYRKGIYDTSIADKKIFYPEGVPFPDPLPLISVMIEKVSTLFDINIHSAAIYTIPFMFGLFVIPLSIYFYLLGYPALGIFGGLIGMFAPMYAGRTSLGRIDADSMIVFFMALASLFVYLASTVRDDKKWKLYLYSSLAGLTIGVFFYWYHHGVFNIVYFALLIFMLAISKFKIKDIVIASVLYIIFTNPYYLKDTVVQMIQSIQVYIFPIKSSNFDNFFPNVYSTIGEAKRSATIGESLRYVIPNTFIAGLGLLSAIVFALRNFKKCIPLAPLFALGLMTFVSSNRFSMFLGPTVGVGIGYIFHTIISNIDFKFKYEEYLKIALSTSLAFIVFGVFLLAGYSNYSYRTGPSIVTPIYDVFIEMDETLPKNSNVLTWWDYGLALVDAGDFNVFHTGMSQESPKTYLIAKALTSSQQDLYNFTSYLDRNGITQLNDFIEDNYTLEMVLDNISKFNEGPTDNKTYVLYTNDMISKYSSISYLSFWDPKKGVSDPRNLDQLNCSSMQDNILTCNGFTINLNTGIINNRATLINTYFTEAGNVVDKIDYQFSSGYTLIVNTSGRGINAVYLISEKDKESSFIDLFFLNQPDTELYELVLDKYPFARLYRLKEKGDQTE